MVQQTENFSFAYLKELFVSATMQWMSARGEILDRASGEPPDNALPHGRATAPLVNDASMDEIILDQATRLRAEMAALSGSPASSQSPASAGGTVARAFANARRFLRALPIPPRENEGQ